MNTITMEDHIEMREIESAHLRNPQADISHFLRCEFSFD
jgi:hypothetical protein